MEHHSVPGGYPRASVKRARSAPERLGWTFPLSFCPSWRILSMLTRPPTPSSLPVLLGLRGAGGTNEDPSAPPPPSSHARRAAATTLARHMPTSNTRRSNADNDRFGTYLSSKPRNPSSSAISLPSSSVMPYFRASLARRTHACSLFIRLLEGLCSCS